MGLVYVQSIYIKRSLIIQNQIFDQYVNEALIRVALKIEEEEAYKLLQKPNLETIYNKAQSINGNCGLSLQYQNGNIILDVASEQEQITFIGSSLDEIDSLVKIANLGPEIENELSNGLLDSYNEMIENMTMQFLYGNNVQPTFDSTKIFNYLSYELNRITINTPFNFALIDGYSFRKIFSTFEKLNSSIQKKAYKTAVHTSFFTGEHAILLIDFPKKRSFLLQSNGELLSSSFIFIILIAASFGASILIIFKQKKLSELKTEFINNMTHELKTPVATIALATEMLKKDKVREDENKVANYNNIISDENKRLGTHIERVLQIAQLDRDEFKLKSETVNLHDLLFELLDKFQLRLEDVNADVETNFLAVKNQVKGDSTHLSNVFSNLLDNAIKYKSESDLKILINTQSTNNKLIIRINDNGIGMGKMDQKKIFTKFYRVPSGNIHNVKGFGLGLSYVKTIIESHKGHIEVDSELNKFTTFTVSLPITNKISL
jgi:two-component system phosphate regulon sensor histidine kinase PhoR